MYAFQSSPLPEIHALFTSTWPMWIPKRPSWTMTRLPCHISPRTRPSSRWQTQEWQWWTSKSSPSTVLLSTMVVTDTLCKHLLKKLFTSLSFEKADLFEYCTCTGFPFPLFINWRRRLEHLTRMVLLLEWLAWQSAVDQPYCPKLCTELRGPG